MLVFPHTLRYSNSNSYSKIMRGKSLADLMYNIMYPQGRNCRSNYRRNSVYNKKSKVVILYTISSINTEFPACSNESNSGRTWRRQ